MSDSRPAPTRTKLSNRVIDDAQPAGREYRIYDELQRDLFLRVYPSGRKVYAIQYRNPARKVRRYTIGLHGRVTVDQARRIAKEKLGEIASGRDPVAEKAELRDRGKTKTIAELAERYKTQHGRNLRSSTLQRNEGLMRRVILPAVGGKPIEALQRKDVADMHGEALKTPVEANRAVRLLSKMMNLAEKWGLRDENTNPCRGVELYRERSRLRYLSRDELERLTKTLEKLEAAGKVNPSVAVLVRLAVLTGARLRSELLPLRWDQVSLTTSSLTLERSKTGPKAIPLPQAAVELLEAVERQGEQPFVFPGTIPGTHLSPGAVDKGWRKIRTEARLEDVRIHDLRHTYAAMGVSNGLSLRMVGEILGHKTAATTQRYAHLAPSSVQEAAEEIGRRIDEAMRQTPKQAERSEP